MKKIPLCDRNRSIVDFALVDDEDYVKLKSYKWHKTGGYAGTNIKSEDEWSQFRMHKIILNYFGNGVVHHRNGNKLDNRKENLQILSYRRHNGLKLNRSNIRKHRGQFRFDISIPLGINEEKAKLKAQAIEALLVREGYIC